MNKLFKKLERVIVERYLERKIFQCLKNAKESDIIDADYFYKLAVKYTDILNDLDK